MVDSSSPRLATPGDIPRLVSGHNVHYEWPPPGTTVLPIAGPEPWVVVQGTPTSGNVGDWYVTTLGQVVIGDEAQLLEFLASRGVTFTGPVATLAGAAGHWPVIYTVGEGRTMRWLASTFRGTLGGVEQFQFGINWGNPGADPDLNEDEALTFATLLGSSWAGAWNYDPDSFGSLKAMTPTDVVYTEIGVVQKTQTAGTNADGTGGNLEQAYDTQWYAYPVGSQPKGTNPAKTLPYEVALALTLHTDHRGASGRGRVYFPPPGTDIMLTGGRFTQATVNLIGKRFGHFLDDVHTASTYKPVVVSRRRIILNEIKQITVGGVPDSQRRRRRSQDEAATVAWTHP